jgi:hypothetical protein
MIRDEISEINPDAFFCDGFDEAIIGMAERIGLGPVVAYDVEKMIEMMISNDEMTYEEAYEYFDFNIKGAWVGDYTPIFITKLEQL